MAKGPPPPDYDENPEWTEEDWANARPISEVCPPHVVAALIRKPDVTPKQQVTLRLDRDALDRFRASGPGWQTRINAAVRKAAGL